MEKMEDKDGDKDEKALYKLMNNAVYCKTMENLKTEIDVELVSNKKDYLNRTSTPSYISQKIFDNDLVAIRKIKVRLTLNKPTYAGICIYDLSKVLMCEFHYDYIKNIHGNKSRLLFTDTDSLMYEIKTEDVFEDFRKDKEMFDFSNYSAESKLYDDSNKLVVGETGEASDSTIKKFVGLKSNMYSFLVEYRHAKGLNKNFVATINHGEYKHVLNRIQIKDHRIETYEISKIFLSCFDDKIYSQNNGYDGLALSS